MGFVWFISRFTHIDGDHLTLLNAYNAFKQKGDSQDWCYQNFLNYRSLKAADDIREQLKQIMIKIGLSMASAEPGTDNYYVNIKKCLLSGYFMQVINCFMFLIYAYLIG